MGARAGAGLQARLMAGLREGRLMKCATVPTWIWVGGTIPQAPGHPTSICDIGIKRVMLYRKSPLLFQSEVKLLYKGEIDSLLKISHGSLLRLNCLKCAMYKEIYVRSFRMT